MKRKYRRSTEVQSAKLWDRGKELADHQRLTVETDIAVYFCAPRSPWQRRFNEKHEPAAGT
jgi:IS30 family transposase